jgi:hypothetical protein
MQILVVVALSLFITSIFVVVHQQVYWFNRTSKDYYQITSDKMLLEKSVAYGIAYLDNKRAWRASLPFNKSVIIRPNFFELTNSKISVELNYIKESKNNFLLTVFVFSLNNILCSSNVKVEFYNSGALKEVVRN